MVTVMLVGRLISQVRLKLAYSWEPWGSYQLDEVGDR